MGDGNLKSNLFLTDNLKSVDLLWFGYEVSFQKAHVVKAWSPAGGAVLGDYRNRRLGLLGGSRSLEVYPQWLYFAPGFSLTLSAFPWPQGEWPLLHAPAAKMFCLTMDPESVQPRTMD
jgi:hypothetical protein